MAKNDRRRTMVFSNVNKKADYKSASRNKQIIDLDDEIIIGIDNPIRDMEKRKIKLFTLLSSSEKIRMKQNCKY